MITSLPANAQLVESANMQADQSMGTYAPMDMSYAGFNSIGMVQKAWLDPLQHMGEGQIKPAYSRYYWSPDLVLPIRVREGMVTLMNFPKWELVEDIYIGDDGSFDAQIAGPNAILLFPKRGAAVGVDSNLIAFGRSGNRYVFYIRSEGVNTEKLTNSVIDIAVLTPPSASNIGADGYAKPAKYNASESSSSLSSRGGASSVALKSNMQEGWMKDIPVDPEKFKFDMEIYAPNPDDYIIAPERVWRDDIFTYIDLGEKAASMNQRPIVNLIIESSESPVGFRARGPNGRLIVVEAIGDMVLRNGKRIVCLKLRRDPSRGLDQASYAESQGKWDVAPPLAIGADGKPINAQVNTSNAYPAGSSGYVGSSSNPYIMSGNTQGSYVSGKGGATGSETGVPYDVPSFNSSDYPSSEGGQGAFIDQNSPWNNTDATISVELGTDEDMSKLEKQWDRLSVKNKDVLNKFEPYFSVDAPADGRGKEVFHLRIGPIKSLREGDTICGTLGRRGAFCSVIRTQ